MSIIATVSALGTMLMAITFSLWMVKELFSSK